MYISILTFILFFLIVLLYSLRISIFVLLLSIKNRRQNIESFVLNNYKSSLIEKRRKLLAQMTNKLRVNNSTKPPKNNIQPIEDTLPIKTIDYCKSNKTKPTNNNVRFTTNKYNYRDERKLAKNLLKIH